MPKDYSRTERVADYLRQELAVLIQQELRDPRVAMVMVNDVEVSRDLAHAKVFITQVGKESAEEAAPAVEALNKAAGFLRNQLARDNSMRTTPRLHFEFDNSVLRGAHLSALIEKAVDADRAHGDSADPSESGENNDSDDEAK